MLAPEELRAIYRRQAGWFAGERNRLLRRARIDSARRVLDLGTGTGEVLPSLDFRAAGFAVGIDRDTSILRLARGLRVTADARALPFDNGVFDLVFGQIVFLWTRPLEAVLAEVARVLVPGGRLVAAAEPDYGGAIEHPPGRSGIDACARRLAEEGADPQVGRKLAGALGRAGFVVECGTHAAKPMETAAAEAPLPGAPPPDFLYVPYFHFLATKR